MAQCTAHNRDGNPCKGKAVTGYPVCRMHGAGSPGKGRPGGRPCVHGAYSKAVREGEVKTFEELRALGVSLTEELALARLQLSRALAWANDEGREACDGKRCPFALVDSRLELVAKVAERCKKVADGILVRIVDEGAVAQIAEVIERQVKDPEALAAIAGELERLGGRAGLFGATDSCFVAKRLATSQSSKE